MCGLILIRIELSLQPHQIMLFNCSLHTTYSSKLYLSQSCNYQATFIALGSGKKCMLNHSSTFLRTSLTGDVFILLQGKANIQGIKPAWLYQWALMTCKIQFAISINSLLFQNLFPVAFVQVKRYVVADFHIPSQQHQIEEKNHSLLPREGSLFL